MPGLRQSTLIQWPTRRRRLVLAGGNGYFYRFPVYDLDRDYYQVSCSVKESYGCGTTDRRTGRFRCRVFEEKNDGYQLDCVDDAEAVISLLSEELGEECLGSRERSEISYKKVEVKKRSKPRGECYLKNNKRAEVERRLNSGKRGYRGNRKRVEIGSKEDNGHENYEGKKLTFESDLLESDSRCQYGSVTLQSKGEVHGRNEDREDSSREEGHRGRRKSSSCSSYYSFSSLENFESDTEVKDEDFGFVEEVSSSIDDLGSGTGGQSEVRALEEFRRHRSDKAAGEEILEQKYSAAGNNIDRDSPKMLEKRLIEVTVREKQSREGSSTKEGKMLRTSHEGYVKASSPQKHFGVDEKESVFTVNLDHRRKKQHIQQICGNDAKMITHSQKRFSGREEKMMGVDSDLGKRTEHSVGYVDDKIDSMRKSQQLVEKTEIQDAGAKRISHSQRHSEARMKTADDNRNLVQSSVQGTAGRRLQDSQRMIHQVDLERKSEVHDTNIRRSSVSHSETHIKSQEINTNFVSSSEAEGKQQYSFIDQKPLKRVESGQGTLDATNLSVSSAGNVLTVTDSQKTTEKRIISQENVLTSVVKPIGKAREQPDQTDERVVQTSLGKKIQQPIRLSSSRQKASKAVSSSQASLTLVSEERMQQITAGDRDKRSSQAILMPPPSQLVDRGKVLGYPISETAMQEVSSETSEGVASALYTYSRTSPSIHGESYGRNRRDAVSQESLMSASKEDALGSAERLEQSSMQIIGEFVEKVRHEVSISEVQGVKKTSDNELTSEEKHRQKSLGRYGSGDSKRSSGGAGAKGPSDEMWDVTDPSVQKFQADVAEGTSATENAIIKRTDRSLWAIIADVVRLRWGSRAGNCSSAGKSGGKSSSTESVSSEAWFSGREADEKSDETVKREKSMQQEGALLRQVEVGQTCSQIQGESSEPARSKETMKHHKGGALPALSMLESGSTPRVSCSTSAEARLDWNSGGSFHGKDRGTHGLLFEEVSESGKLVVSGSGSMEQVKQPDSLSLIEQSESGFTSEVTGSTSAEAEFGWNLDGSSHGTNSEMAPETSLSLQERSIHGSSLMKEVSEAGNIIISGSGSREQIKQPDSLIINEQLGSLGKDGELKQRKLQRNKQVLRDRFDEWEEAYVLETEQRKNDEMFMREALLEANKAADIWEVPVGAVLVQEGKIIARGCNL